MNDFDWAAIESGLYDDEDWYSDESDPLSDIREAKRVTSVNYGQMMVRIPGTRDYAAGTTTFTDDQAVDMAVDAEIRKRIAEKAVQTKLDMVEAYGDDSYEDNDVLRFEKQFEKDGRVYKYAAIKVDGRWYTTGAKSSPQGREWLELVQWLVSGPVPTTRDQVGSMILLEE